MLGAESPRGPVRYLLLQVRNLDDRMRELNRWIQQTIDPHYRGFFMYGEGKGHCWSGPATQAERLQEMAGYLLRTKPDDMTTPWWRY
ncbi:MAG: hypothetical protein VYE68_02045 [Acidobacteriota bacterium]|nr:hypothetical protein [Acidobacteriota bacterium]